MLPAEFFQLLKKTCNGALKVFTYDKDTPNKTQGFTPSEISILKGWKGPTL